MRAEKAPVWAALVLLGAAGCFHLSRPTPQTYDYQLSYSPPQIEAAKLPVVLHVTPLRIASVYDRQSIVYRDGPYSTGTYFYHRWSAMPGDMITDLLVRDLSASGLYRAVQEGPSVIASDYDLSGDIEAFEEVAGDAKCTAHLDIRFMLVENRPAERTPVLLNRAYTADEPCSGTRPSDFVAAMSQAMAKVSADLQRDVHTAIRQEAQSRPSRVEGH